MRRSTVERWATEAAMFRSFITDAERVGWVCYPECCGHDLVMEAGPELDHARWGTEPGDVVAVEGKLRESFYLLEQAVSPWAACLESGHLGSTRLRVSSADWYAVLLPARPSIGFQLATASLQILSFFQPPDVPPWGPGRVVAPEPVAPWSPPDRALRTVPHNRPAFPSSYRVPGFERTRPPLRVPEVQAGRSGPLLVTPWKVAAVRLLSGARKGNGELTTTAFKDADLNVGTFRTRGWIEPVRREGRVTVYRVLPVEVFANRDRDLWPPDLRYPEILSALEAQRG